MDQNGYKYACHSYMGGDLNSCCNNNRLCVRTIKKHVVPMGAWHTCFSRQNESHTIVVATCMVVGTFVCCSRSDTHGRWHSVCSARSDMHGKMKVLRTAFLPAREQYTASAGVPAQVTQRVSACSPILCSSTQCLPCCQWHGWGQFMSACWRDGAL